MQGGEIVDQLSDCQEGLSSMDLVRLSEFCVTPCKDTLHKYKRTYDLIAALKIL